MAGETLIRRRRAGADLDLGCLNVSSELSAWTQDTYRGSASALPGREVSASWRETQKSLLVYAHMALT